MDAPKCRLCGKRHWGVCADIKTTATTTAAPAAPKRPWITPELRVYRRALDSNSMANNVANNVANSRSILVVEQRSPSSTYYHRDADQRRTYQREYMRRRRASAAT